MRSFQTKKYRENVNLNPDVNTGNNRRFEIQSDAMQNNLIFPNTLTYEDADTAFKKFVEDQIKIIVDGKPIPTFTLYSGQRFSEYTQTWKHVDENDNLILNFKTIFRSPNPNGGKLQGGLWNIPGQRRYTIMTREVLDENGTESIEYYSMLQPYCVDLTYRVSFFTPLYQNLNIFNSIINKLFKARQCYVQANGYYLPMIINQIEDETTYTIDDRKYFAQVAEITMMAYIIDKEDFRIDRLPKRLKLNISDEHVKKPKITVTEEEIEKYNEENSTIRPSEMEINFDAHQTKAAFTMVGDMRVDSFITDNIRNFRISINGMPYFVDKGFNLNDGDEVKISIMQIDYRKECQLVFVGTVDTFGIEDEETYIDSEQY